MLYADDSVSFVCDGNPDVVSKSLSTYPDSCNKWLIDNKMSLYVGKLSVFWLVKKESKTG